MRSTRLIAVEGLGFDSQATGRSIPYLRISVKLLDLVATVVEELLRLGAPQFGRGRAARNLADPGEKLASAI